MSGPKVPAYMAAPSLSDGGFSSEDEEGFVGSAYSPHRSNASPSRGAASNSASSTIGPNKQSYTSVPNQQTSPIAQGSSSATAPPAASFEHRQLDTLDEPVWTTVVRSLQRVTICVKIYSL